MKRILFIILSSLFLNLFSQVESECPHLINLVTNPHFENGNTGFSSTLEYESNCYTGYYYVGPNMQSKCSIWPSSFTDHTSGSGNFLMVDGNDSYAPEDVWVQSVQVFANETYTFSFWAKNLYTQFPFSLGFIINGTQTDTTSHIAYGVWTKYNTTWTALTTGIISIAIRQITAGAYRDFGIDDISMGYCLDDVNGIKSKTLQNDLTIYPNPSDGICTVSGTRNLNVRVCIYDILGNCILDNNVPFQTNTHTINLSNQPKGIYFVEIISDQQKIVKKISLQ